MQAALCLVAYLVSPKITLITTTYEPTLFYLKGPCEGDSGGPLFINYGSEGRKRQTLEGITSGGLSCGQNFPSWYTRVCLVNLDQDIGDKLIIRY